LLVFIKALDERLMNALQETVANVAGIFLQVGVTQTHDGSQSYADA
jgi:hypothetical protein